jgi:hypothetical protein
VLIALAATPVASADNGFSLELTAPRPAVYGDTVLLRGRVVPALVDATVSIVRDGAPVGTATTRADGSFVFRTRADRPAQYGAIAGSLAAAPVALAVRPHIAARTVGSGLVGTPLRVEVSVRPALPLRVVVRRGSRVVSERTYDAAARIGLSTRRAAGYRVVATAEPPTGWLAASRTLTVSAVQPRLALGSRGPSVRMLEARLRELRYALQRVDGLYGLDTHQAVLAFQKVSRLPWTGRVDARVWRALTRATVPRARYGGDHIEVSKGRQFLFLVRGGQVQRVVHVSTGATGNTPLGTWRIYRKVTGWDWVLWYPMYFLRGFAIHGYPEVPAYPASHGCVRVPMWIAPELYASMRYGQTIYVYW